MKCLFAFCATARKKTPCGESASVSVAAGLLGTSLNILPYTHMLNGIIQMALLNRVGKIVTAFILGSLLLNLTACSKKPSHNNYNLLFISIDTLRADRLGLYGYGRETSPNLDKFAKESVVFENMVSVSSWTLPTHVSMFTGLYPSSHGVSLPSKVQIGENTKTLAELLKEKGYRNFAFTGGGYVGPRYGFGRGFESYGVHKEKKRDEKYDIEPSIAQFKEKISSLKSEENFFVFFHTFDVHCPYNSPEPYMSMFNSENVEVVDPKKCGDNYYNRIGISDKQALYLSDRYDGGIRWVDTKLQEVFTFLEQQGRLKNTVVVITSDHGDEFHDHGRIGHKKSLYKELLMVPLIIRAPGLDPARIKASTSHVDLFPTVLELLGIKSDIKFDGKSLLPLVNKEIDSVRAFQFSELDMGMELRSHLDEKGHLIKNTKNNKSKYFDLIKDPKEQIEVAESFKEEVTRRLDELKLLMKNLSRSSTSEITKESEEEIERLKSLGYI